MGELSEEKTGAAYSSYSCSGTFTLSRLEARPARFVAPRPSTQSLTADRTYTTQWTVCDATSAAQAPTPPPTLLEQQLWQLAKNDGATGTVFMGPQHGRIRHNYAAHISRGMAGVQSMLASKQGAIRLGMRAAVYTSCKRPGMPSAFTPQQKALMGNKSTQLGTVCLPSCQRFERILATPF